MPVDQAAALGLARLAECGGVAEQRVGRRDGIGRQVGEELRPQAGLVVDVEIVDEAIDLLVEGEVALRQSLIDRMIGPGIVGESPILRSRSDLRGAHRDAGLLGHEVGGTPRNDLGLCGSRAQEAQPGRQDLGRLQADREVRGDGIDRRGDQLAIGLRGLAIGDRSSASTVCSKWSKWSKWSCFVLLTWSSLRC